MGTSVDAQYSSAALRRRYAFSSVRVDIALVGLLFCLGTSYSYASLGVGLESSSATDLRLVTFGTPAATMALSRLAPLRGRG